MNLTGGFVLAVAASVFGVVPSLADPAPDAPPPLTPQQQQQIKEVKLANADFFRALAQKDIVAFDERVADEGVLCGSGRLQIMSKLDYEKLMQSPNFKPMEVKVRESTVHLQGQTVIVLNDIFVQDLTTNQSPKQQVYVMNTFVKRSGRWQVLSSYSASEGVPSPPPQ